MKRTREVLFENLMDTIYEMSRLVKEYEMTPKYYGIKQKLYMLEAHTIRRIGNQKNITISDLAEQTGRTKGSVSVLIDKLVEKRLVIKEQNNSDKRKWILKLTNLGQEVFNYHENLDRTNYSRILDCIKDISDSQIQETDNLISLIIRFSKGKNSNV